MIFGNFAVVDVAARRYQLGNAALPVIAWRDLVIDPPRATLQNTNTYIEANRLTAGSIANRLLHALLKRAVVRQPIRLPERFAQDVFTAQISEIKCRLIDFQHNTLRRE